MAVFGFGRRNAVGRQYNGGNVSVMLPRYTTPPERNTRDWLEMFGRNPRLAVVDRIASDLSTCAGKLYRKDENGEEVEITDHPFLNFMAHPNPLYEMTWGACWRLQQIYLELSTSKPLPMGPVSWKLSPSFRAASLWVPSPMT